MQFLTLRASPCVPLCKGWCALPLGEVYFSMPHGKNVDKPNTRETLPLPPLITILPRSNCQFPESMSSTSSTLRIESDPLEEGVKATGSQMEPSPSLASSRRGWCWAQFAIFPDCPFHTPPITSFFIHHTHSLLSSFEIPWLTLHG